MGKRERPLGLRPIRSFPYMKLQFWDEQIGAWKDIQRKFGDRNSVIGYALDHFPGDKAIRIMLVEDRNSRRVLENLGKVRALR